MGGYAIRVNRFLFLTLSLSLIISVTPPCVPTPFLPLRLGSHALLRPFPLACPLRSALSTVWLVAGDGQHRRPRTTVRRDANRCSSKGEISLLLQALINAIGRRKPRAYKDQ